jgi:hypothetical protein
MLSRSTKVKPPGRRTGGFEVVDRFRRRFERAVS